MSGAPDRPFLEANTEEKGSAESVKRPCVRIPPTTRPTPCRPACTAWPPGRLLASALTAILAPVGGFPGSLSAQTPREEITAVEFSGNESFSDAELSRAVLTTASSCPPILTVTTCALGIDWFRDRQYLSSRVLDDDVSRLRRLYRANGFRGTAVATEVDRNGDGTVAVVFRINEGLLFRIGSIEFTGDTIPSVPEIESNLPVAPGDPASYQLIVARDTLTERLRNAGFAFADVFYGFDRVGDTASVVYRVELGPRTTFGPIAVAGNTVLGDDAILARLPFREGDLFREDRIREAQRSLHDLGIISRALVRRDTARMVTDSVMPVVVEVVEGDVHRIRAAGGANSADCFNVEGRWTSRNFLGGGRTLLAQTRFSNLLAGLLQSTPLCAQAGTGDFGRLNWLASVDFSQPSVLSRRNDLAVGLFAERQSRKNIFVRDAFGMDLGFSRDIGFGSFMSVRFRPQLSRLAAAEVTLCATFLACDPADIEALSSTNWLSPIAVSFNRDRSDNIFNPSSGSRTLLDLEFADSFTGSDYAYLRAFAEASRYKRMAGGTVLALRIRAGRISSGGFLGSASRTERFAEVVPSQKRFYGGGANSVRGFAQSSLGPRSLSIGVEELLRRRGGAAHPTCLPADVVAATCDASPLGETDLFQLRPVGGLSTLEASAELRFELAGGVLGGAAFVDVGQVWPRDPDLRDLETSPGVGVRYNTPFGPVRVDLAYSFRTREPLQVVTSRIRPYVPGQDAPADRIDVAPAGAPPQWIDWIVSDDLAILEPPVLFGEDSGFSFRRFQLHFSIGQAF